MPSHQRFSLFLALLLTLPPSVAQAAPPVCSGANIRLTPDYQYLIGSSSYIDPGGDPESGSLFAWLTNSTPLAAGPTGWELLLHFDGAPSGENGQSPTAAQNLAYAVGKWGQCLALPAYAKLQFPRTNNLSLNQGTIEMWVALRADGTNSFYTNRDHVLFQYRSPNGDYIQIDQASSQVIYAGGTVNGQWQSAYGLAGSMAGWRAVEWHHLAFTWSAAQSAMNFYVDGALAAANNEGHYYQPNLGGTAFSLGGDLNGTSASYFLDEVRLSGQMASTAEIAARARRMEASQPNEVWLPATNVPTGTRLT
jgi:hypothetical protein